MCKIYQHDFAYVVNGAGDDGQAPLLHIAYHSWEHYSSVRNKNGPHHGLPEIPHLLETDVHMDAKPNDALPWMEKVVMNSLPFLVDVQTARGALEAAQGSINVAVERLLEVQDADHEMVDEAVEPGTMPGADSRDTEERKEPSKVLAETSNNKKRPKRETARERKERQKREANRTAGQSASRHERTKETKEDLRTIHI